jgi:hypothetical protein
MAAEVYNLVAVVGAEDGTRAALAAVVCLRRLIYKVVGVEAMPDITQVTDVESGGRVASSARDVGNNVQQELCT